MTNTDTEALPRVTTISQSRPLAASAHTCTVCGGSIAIGTRYERIVLRDNDALDRKHNLRTVKWHLPYCPEASQ